MIVNPPFLKQVETQGYVFSHIVKCQMSSKLRTENVYQHLTKTINDFEVINLYPKDDKIPDILKQVHKWVFPAGIRALKPGEEKYAKVIDIINSKDITSTSSIQDYNYFTIKDPSNNRLYRCVSGLFYEQMSAKSPKERKTNVYLVPMSYCVISEELYYHPMKQLINFLITFKIDPSFYIALLKIQSNPIIDQIVEEEGKLEDFIIQSVFHCAEIKGHNHKLCLNLTSDTINPILYYYNKNDLSQPFLNLVCPSNTSFDHLIFNQSPSNLFYLVICLMMEYQVIITSSKQSTSNLFCENLLTLIRPMQWKGLYYPTHLNSGFNYQTCTQPYFIGIHKKSEDGLERFQKQPSNRVIYDLDENQFIYKSDDIPIPLSYKNYLIKNLNFVIADLRFWEESSMTIEAEMKYKQAFYNFFLLVFHDVLNYFQKGSPELVNQDEQQAMMNAKESQPTVPKNGKPKSEGKIAETEQKKRHISLGYAYFDQEEYIKSFGTQDHRFFNKVSQTQIFGEFVKCCFRSIDFKADYIREMRILETEYSFHQIFLYVNDCRYLAKRQAEQTLNDKILEIEQMQLKIIQGVVNKQFFPEIQICLSLFGQEYLDGFLSYRNAQEVKTTARSHSSSEKQNQGLYGMSNYNQKDMTKIQVQQQQQLQMRKIEMNLLQRQSSPNQPGSFLQLTYRQGQEGDDSQRNLDKNPLYMCEISKIEQAPGQSANNIDRIDEKQYEQILRDMNQPRPKNSNNEWDRISTLGSYNDIDYRGDINNHHQLKNFPNTLQLFNRKSNLENRNNQEYSCSISPEKKQQIINLGGSDNKFQNEYNQFLGVGNMNGSTINNNAFILSHRSNDNTTSNQLEDQTTCSQKLQIMNNLSQTKLSPANSINYNLNFLSNIDSQFNSQQKISTPQNQTTNPQQIPQNNTQSNSLFGNLQSGCFDLWGHYQEEGNFNLA